MAAGRSFHGSFVAIPRPPLCSALCSRRVMNRSWSLKDLRDYIVQKHDKDQSMLDLVSSIDRGISIFRYHFSTARDSLNDFYDGDETAHKKHVERAFGISEDQEEFQLAKIANEANTIAAIYTVRSVFDLFAQLVRRLLLEGKLSEGECNIHRVRDHLQDGPLRSEEHTSEL